MSTLTENIMSQFDSVINGTLIGNVYETIYSIPITSILRENVAIISFTLYLLWYIKAYLSRTELVAKEGSIMHRIAEKIASIHSGYRPTIWCFPASFNTTIFAMIQKCVKHHYYREILKTQDGGLIAIDWANLGAPKKLIVLVLPGLTGSSKENYVTHLVDKAVQAGCTAVVMNYRGIEVELATPRTYCATNYEDLHMVVNHIQNKYSEHRILAVGISLGGIKLGGYLAKQYDDCIISNSMIISAPMNVFYSCQELEKTQYFFTFNRFLARQIGKYFIKHKHMLETDEKYDCSAIAKCSSIRDFDIQFTSKQFGYKSCEDYYKDACLDAKIKNIRVPTLFLNAGDDMFSPERAFPINEIKNNEYTAMVWTKYGGHISFCEGLLPTGCNYSCRILKEYIQIVLKDIEDNIDHKAKTSHQEFDSNKKMFNLDED